MSGGLRALYRTLELPGANPLKVAHAALDAAVIEAYGFGGTGTPLTPTRASTDASPKGRGGNPTGGQATSGTQTDLLAQLLALNLAVAARIEKGEPVTAPGVPAHYPDPKKLITDDCIRPKE